MAKIGVAALAASEMMKQGSAVVSPQARTVQQQLRSADCTTIKEQGRHLIKDTHPDKGGSAEDFRAVYGTLTHRRGQCNLRQGRGDTEQDSKPKPNRKTGESAKKAQQRERRERRAKKAKEREEQAKAKARTQRQQEADARAGRRQQENTESTGTNYMRNIGVGAAAVGAAGLVARGRQRVRNTRIETDDDGRRFLIRIDNDSIVRELTPERRE
jgi:cobalamin biosynthesis Mg chelatase CobN